MNGIVFADDVMAQLRRRNPRYHESGYLFILSALHFVLERLDQPRHITGQELAGGVRDLALRRFGPMARTVLEHWGLRSTADMGEMVFALVECGVLLKQEGDSVADFVGVYDFEETFDRDYPWGKLS